VERREQYFPVFTLRLQENANGARSRSGTAPERKKCGGRQFAENVRLSWKSLTAGFKAEDTYGTLRP
jgi:hypothetical protein